MVKMNLHDTFTPRIHSNTQSFSNCSASVRNKHEDPHYLFEGLFPALMQIISLAITYTVPGTCQKAAKEKKQLGDF